MDHTTRTEPGRAAALDGVDYCWSAKQQDPTGSARHSAGTPAMQTPAESMPHCLSQNRGSTRLDRLIGELRDRRQQLGETQLSALQT
jgi:hypothetical protein